MLGTYVCLSYCWGDSKSPNQIGRTTSANLSEHLQAISFNSLPKTIIDALHLCYELGFRYLWVDRLCIIQDDKEDWRKEASQMCDIYSRSALTISVPLCIQSSQSFLAKRRNPRLIERKGSFATIDYIDTESNSNGALCVITGLLSRSQASWFLEDNWDYFAISDSHHANRWITRGWTFQEWMLSPRVLHIDTATLWDCFEGYANELNRRYMEKPIVTRDPRDLGRHVSWDSIVEEYSSRQTTYEEDKLPALDGLATRYHQSTGYTYLAGLWLEQMPRSLLWQRYYEATTSVNRTVPSWSWASLNTKAGYVYGYEDNVWVTESFLPCASICSWFGSPISVSTSQKAWIDIKGYISGVVDQDPDAPGIAGDCLVKVDNKWWHSVPDHGRKYRHDQIAQSNVYLIVLGWVNSHNPAFKLCGGLVLQWCGEDDDRLCFRRLGIATLGLDEIPWLDVQHETSWESHVVHLI